jgi:hypothetical protein
MEPARATCDDFEHLSGLIEDALDIVAFWFERAALASGPMTGAVKPEQFQASQGLDFVNGCREGLGGFGR